MPFFRELPAKMILLLHLAWGVVTGWFLVQGVRLALGLCYAGTIPMTGLFFRVCGVQLAFLQFIIVWVADKYIWQKKRVKTPPRTPVSAREVGLLFGALLCYAAGAAAINLIRLI